ncbi:threonine/homoserine/homoserine lactone efflux protein [Phyllobacterium trifolii]|uniref:Threonine/homoserine/homoserine lactone efflux protein n=1 Tax=Phyllobacterium trifolii TaxID=300193 RepID=A0A839UL74_9HYPH|nr:threonine/homoserine/homoserine lactone efflux protein [Phyllobacterium trifolii]
MAVSNWQAFRLGAVTCLINPKAYLFMLAVYPQFLRPDFGPLAPQAAVMAAMTAGMQLVSMAGSCSFSSMMAVTSFRLFIS